jgi:hypothetical protein
MHQVILLSVEPSQETKTMSDKPTAPTKSKPVIWDGKLARFLIVVAIGAAGYLAYQPVKWLLLDWDGIEIPGVKKVADIEIGFRGTLLKDSSLRLVCGADGTLQMVDFTHVPIPQDFQPLEPDASTGILLVYRKGEFDTSVKIEFPGTIWYPKDQIDVVVTPPISTDRIEQVAQAFDRTSPFNVAFHVSETAARFVPIVDGSAIRSLIASCP